jgi:hypothetical protein
MARNLHELIMEAATSAAVNVGRIVDDDNGKVALVVLDGTPAENEVHTFCRALFSRGLLREKIDRYLVEVWVDDDWKDNNGT